MAEIKYRRVLVKLSGEAMLGKKEDGIDFAQTLKIAEELQEVLALGVKLAVVFGGGNIFRGFPASQKGMDRAAADYIGMLATVINCLALQEMLKKCRLSPRVISALEIPGVAAPYVHDQVLKDFDDGRIILFAGGTGHPYFTTDTAAVLRALEMKAEIILKATKVDGVYNRDPHLDPEARRWERLTFTEALSKNLKVMDATALSLCRDNHLPLGVFNFFERGNIARMIKGENIGTMVEE